MSQAYQCDICKAFYVKATRSEYVGEVRRKPLNYEVRFVFEVSRRSDHGSKIALDLCRDCFAEFLFKYLDKLGIEPPSPSATEAG